MKKTTLLVLAGAVAGVFSGDAVGQMVVTQLLAEGQTVAPFTTSTTLLQNPRANNVGGWLMRVRTGDTTSSNTDLNTDMLYGRLDSNSPVGSLVQEGPGVLALSTNAVLRDSGSLTYSATSTNVSPRLASVFAGSTLLAQSGSPMPTGVGNDGLYFGRSVALAGVSSGGDTFVVSTINSSASLPTGETSIGLFKRTSAGVWSRLIQNGQTIADVGTIAANKSNSLGSVAVSSNGSYWLSIVDTNTAVSNTTNFALKNGVLERTASGLPMRVDTTTPLSVSVDLVKPGEAISSLGISDVNDSGTVARSVSLTVAGSGSSSQAAIFVDGKVRYHEGDTLNGVTLSGNINNLSLNNDGDLLWSLSNNGLFLNDTLVVPSRNPAIVGLGGGVTTPLTSFSENIGTTITDRDINGYVTVYFLGRTDGTTSARTQTDTLYQARVNLSRVAWTAGSGTWGAISTGFTTNPSRVGAAVGFEVSSPTLTTVTLTSPQTSGGIWLNSPGGYTFTGSTLNLNAGIYNATVTAGQGTNTISSSLVVYSPLVLETTSSSTLLNLTQPLTSTMPVVKTGAGSLLVPSIRSGSVAVANGSVKVLSGIGGSRLAIETGGISIGLGAFLDLINRDMIVHGSNNDATINLLRRSVGNWFNGGQKNGTTGLAASEAAPYGSGTASSFLTLAIFPNSFNGEAYYTSYDGVAVDATDVIVRYTYLGDLNIDGVVDGQDYKIAAEGAALGLQGWQNGDVNYDGVVNDADVIIVAAAQAANLPALPSGGGTGLGGQASIPEPGMGILVSAGAMALGLRRRRI